MRRSKVVLVFAAFVVAATAAATVFPHRLYGKRIAGQVVDAVTGRPVAGAHVAFLWESGIIPSGFTGHNSRDICYHAAAAITDQQGRFEIAPWQEWSTYDVGVSDPIALVYAKSYVPREVVKQDDGSPAPSERPNERYALDPFSGTTQERMNMLFWGLANHDCPYGGQSQKSLYQMLKAIHDEAQSIARTEDDRRIAHGIARLTGKRRWPKIQLVL
jgi:hypothetical protein